MKIELTEKEIGLIARALEMEAKGMDALPGKTEEEKERQLDYEVLERKFHKILSDYEKTNKHHD